MTGRRRLGTILPPAKGYVPGAVDNREPVQEPTLVNVTAATPEPPPVPTEIIAGSAEALADAALAEEFARYEREPVPDLYSTDPADRTEWLRLHEGDETDFAAVLNDHPQWLYLLGLPAPETTEAPKDAGSGASPRSGEDAAGPAAAAAHPSPQAPEPASDTEGEPVQDEPAAEPDCGETGGVA